MVIKTVSLQRRQKGRSTNVPVNDHERHEHTYLSHPRRRQPVPVAKDHILSGCVIASNQYPFASAFERSNERPYASTASGRVIQWEIATPGHVVRAENAIIRCYIRQTTLRVSFQHVQSEILSIKQSIHNTFFAIPFITHSPQTTQDRPQIGETANSLASKPIFH